MPEHDAEGLFELIGYRRNRARARLAMQFIAPHLDPVPVPPDELTLRVSDLASDAFRQSGLKAFTDLWELIRRHCDVQPEHLRILDWGSGCGRVSRNLARLGVQQLQGCDIDSAAVAWCSENLPGDFQRTGTEPPLPYENGSVDVVVAVSVFAHLTRQRQMDWLREMRRILAPGGLLLASTAGPTVRQLGRSKRLSQHQPGSLIVRAAATRRIARLQRAGITDENLDDHLDDIAPDGYYRMTSRRSGTRSSTEPRT